jgi:hydroxymethylpyrimidine/phosphomethylpyrimidine kinase
MIAGARRKGDRPAPLVLALSGLEPTGRAGLFADLEAIRAAGGVAAGIATALTAQGERTFAVAKVPEAVLRSQILAVSEMATVSGVKLGMVSDGSALRLVLRTLKSVGGIRVVDPVTRTSRGQRLSQLRPNDYLAAAAPNVALTPNLDEAAWLLRTAVAARTPDRAARLAERLASYGFAAVIVKGGDLAGRAVDVLCDKSGVRYLDGARIRTRIPPRGTGCRFASVLATSLARGQTMANAASEAKALVRSYLRALLPLAPGSALEAGVLGEKDQID